jgi:hypothetical protein
MTTIAVGATVASGAYSAHSQYAQGLAQKNLYEAQAAQAREQGALAIRESERQSTLVQDTAKEEGRRLKESQAEFNASSRAAMAAAGVYGGTAEDILSSNISKEQRDEMALRYNADVKSWEAITQGRYSKWASDVESENLEYAGRQAKKSGKRAAIGTLLGTAGQAFSMGAGMFGGGGGSSLASQTQAFGGGTKAALKPSSSFYNKPLRFTPRY